MGERQDAGGIYCSRAPAADLPALLRGAPWAVLIDAVRAGAEPGTPLQIEADDLADDAAPASTHGVGVSATLALLDLLGELPVRVCIVGIEVGEYPGEPPQDWVPPRGDGSDRSDRSSVSG